MDLAKAARDPWVWGQTVLFLLVGLAAPLLPRYVNLGAADFLLNRVDPALDPLARPGPDRRRAGLVALWGMRSLGSNLTPGTEPLAGSRADHHRRVRPRQASDLYWRRPAAGGIYPGVEQLDPGAARGLRCAAVFPGKGKRGGEVVGGAVPRISDLHAAGAAASTLNDHPRISFGPFHRGHFRHGRSRTPGLSLRPPGLVQPGPGTAGDRTAARGAPAGEPGRDRSGRPGLRANAGPLGAAPRGGRRSTTSSTARGCARSTPSENVCICGGGRASLTRAVAALGQVNLGHFLPDYTAYEELLDIFKLFTPIPILLEARAAATHFGLDDLRREIIGRGLSALLLSNPCNPTGQGHPGRRAGELGGSGARAGLLAADRRVLLPLRLGRAAQGEPGPVVSAARYVEDVDRDPVVLFDGLTKNWRYPGLAVHLDRGAAAGDRGGREQRLLPRRRRQQAAAAVGDPAARLAIWCGPRPARSAALSCAKRERS